MFQQVREFWLSLAGHQWTSANKNFCNNNEDKKLFVDPYSDGQSSVQCSNANMNKTLFDHMLCNSSFSIKHGNLHFCLLLMLLNSSEHFAAKQLKTFWRIQFKCRFLQEWNVSSPCLLQYPGPRPGLILCNWILTPPENKNI